MNGEQIVQVVLAMIGGGGVLTAFVQYRRMPADRAKTTVDTMGLVQAELKASWLRARRRAAYWKLRARRAEAMLVAHAIALPPEPTRADVDLLVDLDEDEED